MAKRPDLDALSVSKTTPTEAKPEPRASDIGTLARNYAHTLTLRLTAADYQRLRNYVIQQEKRTGRRTSHQAVMELALHNFLMVFLDQQEDATMEGPRQ